MLEIFRLDMADKMSISLLPLSFRVQPDPIQFLRRSRTNPPKKPAVAQYLREIAKITRYLESQNLDTSRFLTVYRANLQSVKKISSADVVVGVQGKTDKDPLVIERRMDPNVSHPLRRKDILEVIGNELSGIKFTSYTFEAIAWRLDWKMTPNLCWRSDVGGLIRYSAETPSLIKRMSKNQIEEAIYDYKFHQRELRRKKHSKAIKQKASVVSMERRDRN